MPTLWQTLVLFALWLVFSGKFTPFHMGAGLAASLAVAMLFQPLRGTAAEKPAFWGRLCLYLPWLVWRVALANFHTAALVLKPEKLDPQLIKRKLSLRSRAARAFFANSVTLTPGTVSCELADGELWVHALDKPSAWDVDSGLLENKVAWLFGEERP